MKRNAIWITNALMCSTTTVVVLVTSSRTAKRKFPHQKHLVIMIGHDPSIATTEETDHIPSITDAGKGTGLTNQNCTINLNVTEAPVILEDMKPTLYHATTAAHYTHPQTDTPEGTPTGTSTW